MLQILQLIFTLTFSPCFSVLVTCASLFYLCIATVTYLSHIIKLHGLGRSCIAMMSTTKQLSAMENKLPKLGSEKLGICLFALHFTPSIVLDRFLVFSQLQSPKSHVGSLSDHVCSLIRMKQLYILEFHFCHFSSQKLN